MGHTVSNLSLWGEVPGCAMASQFYGFLDAADYLDPFQYSSGPASEWFVFVDDFSGYIDRGSVFLLVFLALSVSFHNIKHDIQFSAGYYL